MKIFMDNVNFSSASGPNSFAGRLAHELSLRGHIIADPDDYDVALSFIEPRNKFLPGKPVIQRLDGIWFKPEQYESHNRTIKSLYQSADHVIWQSDFDADMTQHWWGNPKSGSVIRNGINLKKVESKNPTFVELKQRYEKVFVCSSNWHPQKRLYDNIELFKHLRATQFPYSCLLVLGAAPDVQVADKNVYYTGVIPHQLCLEIYSIADWMIHLAWLDHCPNVVVEALSQGCPVICAESGGTKELVRTNGLVLAERDAYNFELADYDSPPRIDVTQIKNLERPLVECYELDIKLVAQKYEAVFDNVCK